MTTSEIITARNEIASLALAGDSRYDFDPIGDEDNHANEMSGRLGLPRVYSAESFNDVAVYSDGTQHVLVCDANGPIAIRVSGGAK